MYIEYLDLPSVPNELIDSYEEILNLPYTRKLEQSAPQYDFYKTRFIKKDLWDWLHSEIFPWFGSSFNAQYQILKSNIHRHKDIGRKIGRAHV